MNADTRTVKEWVGALADDATIAEALVDLVDPRKAALSILRQRRADMAANMGGTLAVYRDVTISITAEQLAELDKLIAGLESILGTGDSVVSVGSLDRRSERDRLVQIGGRGAVRCR